MMELDVIARALLGTNTPPVVADVMDSDTMVVNGSFEGRQLFLKRVTKKGATCSKPDAFEKLQAMSFDLVPPDCLQDFLEGHDELWGRRVKCIVAIDFDIADSTEATTAKRLNIIRNGGYIVDEPMDDPINGMVWIPVVRTSEPHDA